MYFAEHPEADNESMLPLALTLLISFFILFILLIIEIIISIIAASKIKESKNNFWIYIFIFLFNVFYIPCFQLKYKYNDKNYKTKNLIYLIISIGLYVGTIIYEIISISKI